MKIITKAIALAALAGMVFAQTIPAPQQIAALVYANDLKADVSFLASDALQGRATPSPGLEIAAEYIAAQFRRASLEPGGSDNYFQQAIYTEVKPRTEGLELTVTVGKRQFALDSGKIIVLTPSPLQLENAQAILAPPPSEELGRYEGKVVIADMRNLSVASLSRAKLLILFDPPGARGVSAFMKPRSNLVPAPGPTPRSSLYVSDSALISALQETKDEPITVSARIPGPAETQVKLRNVIGVIRGATPGLKEECVVVSAHYDHTGVLPTTDGDNILNGANDDASGTAGVIAIAKALSALPSRPKRSIVFLCVFGEERGLLGSRHYVQNPLFPMSKTIANINLEQIGRTDSRGGQRLLQFNLSGHDYTTLAAVFDKVGQETGVRLVKDGANSEQYFGGSDNISFALAGVPSTTVSVTYQFPDYHGVGDEWSKLDYQNMARVTGTIAASVFQLADGEEAPRWIDNPQTERFRKVRASEGK